jgi:hypothetical protein
MRITLFVFLNFVVAILGAASASATPTLAPVPVDVMLEAPPEFGESCCLAARSGTWLGPEYLGSDGEKTDVRARIDWSIASSVRGSGADAAARAALGKGWVVIEAGVRFVPHTIRSRQVGEIPASYFIASWPGTARYELSIAAPLRGRVFALVLLRVSGTRAGSRASTSAYAVNGVQAAEWNLEALRSAVRTLSLGGNLPPAMIELRPKRDSLRGAVKDVNDHPLVGVPITLQRKVSGRWTAAGRATTTTRGTFVVSPAFAPGLYRASASVAGVKVQSRTVRQ